MTGKTVLYDVRDGVATITLNRPEALNTLNAEFVTELRAAATACEADRSVRAVILRGNGSSFCGGGDVKWFAANIDTLPTIGRELATDFHVAISRLVRLDAPVIAAVQGAAAGGGLSLVCLADIVLAADTAKFRVAYTAIGVTMDGGSTYFLPRLVGLRRAIELAITNRTLSATEAMELGIVTEVVPELELHDRAEALAAKLAKGPTRAYGRIKALLHESVHETLETQLELESREITAAFGTHDGKEGITAFAEKRAPKFLGE